MITIGNYVFKLVENHLFGKYMIRVIIPLTNASPTSDLKTTLLIVDKFSLSLMIIGNLIHMEQYLLKPLVSCNSLTVFTMVISHD